MADNKMKDDMGTSGREGREGQDFGKQTPGRNPEGGPRTGQPGQPGQQGGKEPLNRDDDEMEGGSTGNRRGQNRGGQNR